jgi:hypothetical protein
VQQAMQFEPIHTGHRHVENQAGRPVDSRSIQTRTTGFEEYRLETKRPDQTT